MEHLLQLLNDLDTKLFLTLNGSQSLYLDNFMSLFTGKFIWVPMYAMLLLVMFKSYGWRRGLLYTIAVAAAIAVADQMTASLMRPIVCRLRPSNPDNPLSAMVKLVDGYRGGRYGFPSCHAANSFAFATFLSLLFKSRRFFWFNISWAFINSYSRLYLGVHYPGDLMVGASLGALYGYVIWLATMRLGRYVIPGKPHDGHFTMTLGRRRLTLPDTDLVIAVGILTIVGILIASAVK